MFTKKDLKEFQSEPLDRKEQRSLAKASEWFAYWNAEVYVSFSGGKDSSVLADICGYWCSITKKTLYLAFADTGLEYPEIKKHVKHFAEYLRRKYHIEVVLDILRPKMRFDEVIKEYGYPIISKEISLTIEYARKGSEWALYKLQGKNADGTDSKRKAANKKYAALVDMDANFSNKCCWVMKKVPFRNYERQTGRKAIIATLAEESSLRENAWLKNGCNAFNAKRAASQPMSFWTEQDVLQYIKREQDRYDREYKRKIEAMKDPSCRGGARRRIRKWLLSEYEFSTRFPLASVYGNIEYAEAPDQMRIEDFGIANCGAEKLKTTGCDRTGCVFCAFGCHLEKLPSRFERLKETHPRQYEYCIGGGEYVWTGRVSTSGGDWRDVPWINDDGTQMTAVEIERFVEQNKDNESYDFRKIWKPNKQGLGLGHVFDELNKIYGEDFIRY